MSDTERLLTNDIKLTQDIGKLADNVDKAIVILARAILELDSDLTNNRLRLSTADALRRLAASD